VIVKIADTKSKEYCKLSLTIFNVCRISSQMKLRKAWCFLIRIIFLVCIFNCAMSYRPMEVSCVKCFLMAKFLL